MRLSRLLHTRTMPQERLALKDSACRGMSPEETKRVFDEMLKGSEEGVTYCLRIKIDMQSENGALRDPVVFRCNDHRHWRTGTKYKVGGCGHELEDVLTYSV